jgi:hypothetical protein
MYRKIVTVTNKYNDIAICEKLLSGIEVTQSYDIV